MKARKIALGMFAALVVSGLAGWFSLDKETRGLLATLPTNRDVLFWSEPQRDAAFRALDRLPVLAKWHIVPVAAPPMPLTPGRPLKLAVDVDSYMASASTPAGAGRRSRSPSRSPRRWSVLRSATATSGAWTTRSATTCRR